jgi:hypothetical protein
MYVMAKVDNLSFIPGSFLGAVAFFGSGVNWMPALPCCLCRWLAL